MAPPIQPPAVDRNGKKITLPQDNPFNTSVLLNVYDLGESSSMKKLNSVSSLIGGGVYHAGVEVNGAEWSYGFTEVPGTGVHCCVPRCHPGNTYKTSVVMGTVKLNKVAIDKIIDRLREEWQGMDYHLLKKNCLEFSTTFTQELGLGKIPSWVDRYGRSAKRFCKKDDETPKSPSRLSFASGFGLGKASNEPNMSQGQSLEHLLHSSHGSWSDESPSPRLRRTGSLEPPMFQDKSRGRPSVRAEVTRSRAREFDDEPMIQVKQQAKAKPKAEPKAKPKTKPKAKPKAKSPVEGDDTLEDAPTAPVAKTKPKAKPKAQTNVVAEGQPKVSGATPPKQARPKSGSRGNGEIRPAAPAKADGLPAKLKSSQSPRPSGNTGAKAEPSTATTRKRGASPKPKASPKQAELSAQTLDLPSIAITNRPSRNDNRDQIVRRLFETFDTDANGILTLEELRPFADQFGFQGDDAEWRQWHASACAEVGVSVEAGMSREDFGNLVADAADEDLVSITGTTPTIVQQVPSNEALDAEEPPLPESSDDELRRFRTQLQTQLSSPSFRAALSSFE